MENVPNTFPQLFFVYTACILLVVAYVISLARRIARLESDASGKK
jgi:hypothetical protein